MLQMRRFNMGAVGEADCPVFDGLFEYCAVSSCTRLQLPAVTQLSGLVSAPDCDHWSTSMPCVC